MEFRVLGPLEVVHDGAHVDVGGPRQQIVLAILLLEAPRVVPVDLLVDAVWADDPPATARSQIQICVSNLRQRVAAHSDAASILTRRPGYVLDLGSAAFDLLVFDDLVTRARAETAAGRVTDATRLLRSALVQWRGVPLAGIESRAVRDAAVRLEDSRIAAVEEFCDLELRLGRHAEVVGMLGKEVDRNPLREHLRGQLMLALYRSGRQSEALREFRTARRTFVDELGIEPSTELRRLEEAILRGDPALTGPRPPDDSQPERDPAGRTPVTVPRMLSAEVADFTGRTRHATAAAERLVGDGAGPSAMPIVVITGPGGVGKSTLALHVAHRIAGSFPDGQLFASMHGGTRPVRPAQALERFLRALGVPGTAVPEGVDERAELYRSLLADRRILVVLDDIVSESHVTALLPPGGRCAVLITSRRRLTALPGATRVELGAFSKESAIALLGRVVGADLVAGAAEEAAELVELCGYLPLAVRIAAARLAARPHWSIATMVERLSSGPSQLDELRHGEMAVGASLMLTYEALEPEVRRLLRLVGLIDSPDFGGWACGPLLDLSTHRAEDLLAELVEMHLVHVEAVEGSTDPSACRYRLHDLVRLFARERTAAEDSTEARGAAIARYLGALMHLVESAHGREYGGDFLVVHGAAARYPLDPRVTDRLLARPLFWLANERKALVAAVTQATSTAVESIGWDLAVTAVTLFEARAHFDDWRETHNIALAAARRAGDRLGEAVTRYSIGSLHMFEQQFAEADQHFAEAEAMFAELGCKQGLAMVLRNRAFIDRVMGDYLQARGRNHEALIIFGETGDRAGEAHVLSNQAQIDIDLDRDDAALAGLERAREICVETANRRVGAQVLHRLGEIYLRQRRLADATDAFEQVLAFAGLARDRTAETFGLVGLGSVAIERGDHASARTLLAQAGSLATELGEKRMQVRALLLSSRVALDAGDGQRAHDHVEDALRIAERLESPLWIAMCLDQSGAVQAGSGELRAAEASWHAALGHLRAITLPVAGRLRDGLLSRLRGCAEGA